MRYTVKELGEIAGVSARTLRYYDQIGLLPAARADRNNEERRYDYDAVLRLQQILFYRALDFRLGDIRALLDDPAYDILQALRGQRELLQQRREHVDGLLRTIENTLNPLEGKTTMKDNEFFEGFDNSQYEEEARQRWGADIVDESTRRWNARSPEEQKRLMEDQQNIFATILDAIDDGPGSARVQSAVARLHENVNMFWDCGDDAFRGLGDLYVTDPRFRETFARMDERMPDFMREAIGVHCDRRAAG